MATSKTARKSTAAPARALPAALQKNADRMVAMAKKRLTDAARKALASAREAHAEALRGTYELGQALALLKAPGMSEAAGFADGPMRCARASSRCDRRRPIASCARSRR